MKKEKVISNKGKIFPGRRKGAYLPVIMMVSVLFLAYAVMMITFSLVNIKTAIIQNKHITSMAIAEAGINYYLWHLSHNNLDYCDGNTPCTGTDTHGPYTHQYKDQAGRVLGTYDLYVTPPQAGATTTVVKSVGKVNGISPKRTIVSELAMPSYTKFTMFMNGNNFTLGSDGKIEGTVMVNNAGLYNLGEITGDASSTETSYTHPVYGLQDGVAGPGVFGGTKMFPVMAIDSSQVGVDITALRNNTKSNGYGDYYDASSGRGYHVVLKSSGYDLYTVNTYSSGGNPAALNITKETIISTNHAYPEKGILFFEDNVWVEGTLSNHKITIAASDPEANINQRKMVVISNNINYTNYDGSDKIGLISQTGIYISKTAPSNLRIDAAMLAPFGAIQISNYGEVKNSLYIYGSLAGNSATFKYTSGATVVGGFRNRTIKMDSYNVLNPPPEFPKTGTYSIMSWREE